MKYTRVYETEIKKKNKKMKKIYILFISLFMISIVLMGSFFIKKYYRNVSSLSYDNYQLYQYFSGVKVIYDGKVTINHENKITKIASKEKNVDAGDIPIYYQNIDNSVILPNTMSLIFPANKTKNCRLNYLTRLTIDKVDNIENVFITDNKVNLSTSFLFNGENLYFFPYSTTIVIDNNVYELSPLSYVIVNYKSLIEIYDKATDKYTIIDSHENDVIATLENFKINLSTDMVMYENENKLLIKKVDLLPLYEEK